MKLLKLTLSFLIILSSVQPIAYAQNHQDEAEALEQWKENLKECVKDENKAGFWVDLALDESGSMQDFDPQRKALQATADLIEELSNKVDRFNDLDKDIYFNFYPWSANVTSVYSTGKPIEEQELENLLPLEKYYKTGGGTAFDRPFYQIYQNSISNPDDPTWLYDGRKDTSIISLAKQQGYEIAGPPIKLDVNSKDLDLCHIAIFLTDGENLSNGYWEDYANKYLNQDHTFLLAIQVGKKGYREPDTEGYYKQLKKQLANENVLGGPDGKNNALVLKIESTDELFLLWEEVTDAAEEGARESSNKEDRTELPEVIIEICPSSTVPRENDKCGYNFELNPLAENYFIEGSVKNSDGSNGSIEDLELRIIPPNQNTSLDFSLSEITSTTIKDVDFIITPKRKTFLIYLTPQSNKKDPIWLGNWTLEVAVKGEGEVDGRYIKISPEIKAEATASLSGNLKPIPFEESCYDILFTGKNGKTVSTKQYSNISVEILVEDSLAQTIDQNYYSDYKKENQYCFEFKSELSNEEIVLIPKAGFITKEGTEIPTKYLKFNVTIGQEPQKATISNFQDLDFGNTGTTKTYENLEIYTVVIEQDSAVISFTCSNKIWDSEESQQPNHEFRFVSQNIQASCGEDVVLKKGSYSFSALMDIQNIYEGDGQLIYTVTVEDKTFDSKIIGGPSEFRVYTYFVPFTSRLMWAAILLILSLATSFGINRIIGALSKGFYFPQNFRVIQFNLNKDTSEEEFVEVFTSTTPKGLPSGKLRDREINGIKFYSKSGKASSIIYLNAKRDVFRVSYSEPVNSIDVRDLQNTTLYVTESQTNIDGVYFIDDEVELDNIHDIFRELSAKLNNKGSISKLSDEADDDKSGVEFSDSEEDEGSIELPDLDDSDSTDWEF
jgi:hypothetical protein